GPGRRRPNVAAINVAEGCAKTDRSGKLCFHNLRAYAYWCLREALDPERGDELALPPDAELLADLAAPRWQLTARGIKLEAKDGPRPGVLLITAPSGACMHDVRDAVVWLEKNGLWPKQVAAVLMHAGMQVAELSDAELAKAGLQRIPQPGTAAGAPAPDPTLVERLAERIGYAIEDRLT